MLPIPSSDVEYIEWPEHDNPYEHAVSAFPNTSGTVFVDGSIRKFLADGLQSALPNAKIVTSPLEINQLRERKSEAELNILKCANEVGARSNTRSLLHRLKFTGHTFGHSGSTQGYVYWYS
jgi:Xaa-Pro aminopeptidase